MARMYGNYKCSSGNFGDGSQLTYWILDSGATCHITPEVAHFIPGSLEDTDKHIEVVDGNHAAAKKRSVQINFFDDHGNPFIATLHNILLARDLCNRFFSIITVINLGHTCLFRKEFCNVHLGVKDKNSVSLPHSTQRKHAFWGKSRKCQILKN